MNVLEKILKEIDKLKENCLLSEFENGYTAGALDMANAIKKAIHNNMDEVKVANIPTNNGWIPVEERLPEANEIVMVTVHSSEWVSDFDTSFVPEEEKKFHPERYDVFVGYFMENREWVFFDESMSETSCEKEFGNDKGYIYSIVTAWKPLPEPYKPK